MSNFAKQISRFLLSGGGATAIHFTIMACMIAIGQNASVATAVGAAAGAAANYILQYHWTFQSSRRHALALPGYLLASVTSWIVNLLIFFLLHEQSGLAVLPAQVITTGALACLNYLLYRTLVFL